ncbi:MAG: serine/threonine-protein kinase [Pirellula sp.]
MNTNDDLAKRPPSEAPQNQNVPMESLETLVRKSERGISSLASGTPSRHIGNYKLLQLIGEGGMGAVWMAEQTEPVKRRVALKLIKTGNDSKPIIARFEAERQALALMDHPSIAKILDGGTTDFGQPYFVMELVAGIPITHYCDKHRLSLPERLGLFTQVCNAIQHAHQKGIIHRDLKPANILVGVYDGKPVPKVIDFGLAKALDHQSKLTDKTLFTEFGAVVGTLQYMSPEQADLDSVDIDTRADIYALGVLLYELLTGSTPIEVATLKQLALLKVLETIRDTDPPRPSARLSSSIHQLHEISGNRQIDPLKLQSELRSRSQTKGNLSKESVCNDRQFRCNDKSWALPIPTRCDPWETSVMYCKNSADLRIRKPYGENPFNFKS